VLRTLFCGGGRNETEGLDGNRGKGKAQRSHEEGADTRASDDFPKWEEGCGRCLRGGMEAQDEAERELG
jgi:hypothetical protein